MDPESISIPIPENASKLRRSRLFSSIINGNQVNPDFPSNGTANSNSSSSAFNYSCSLSPNSQSSSSSEVQVSSPNYHVSTTSSPPVMCSLLGQAAASGALGPPNLVLPAVLTACSATGKNASLPFKLRHKAQGGAGNGSSASGPPNGSSSAAAAGNGGSGGGGGGSASLSNGSNGASSVCSALMMHTGNDSDASSDGSSVPQLSSSLEAVSVFAEAVQSAAAARENACSSPDSQLKTENYALKSELQRLASEVATLKNVLVYSSQSVAAAGQMSALADLKAQMTAERCATLYRPVDSPLNGVGGGGVTRGGGGHHHHHHHHHSSHHSHHSPVHFPDDLVDSKVLLSNVIQFQKLNDIIV